MGLYIAERAGFEIQNAPSFWRRMAAEHPGSIKSSFAASHPSTPERFVALEQAVQEIQKKKENGEALVPEKKK
jgi:predicted Zn-dependent protease